MLDVKCEGCNKSTFLIFGTISRISRRWLCRQCMQMECHLAQNEMEPICSIEKRQVPIASGSFTMGNTDYGDQFPHKVMIDSFSIDNMQVTQGDYKAIMGINPSYFKDNDTRPVECVTWYDAVLFCNARSKCDGLEPVYHYSKVHGKAGDGCRGLENLKIDYRKNGYRLPTEAEWEYACRAGTTTKYFWGDTMNGDFAWWAENAGVRTKPTGTKKPNAWDLYDMSGNVWDWCNDWYGEKYYAISPDKNPHGPDSGQWRVLRGGSWYRNNLCYLSSAIRFRNKPEGRNPYCGFRCVAVLF